MMLFDKEMYSNRTSQVLLDSLNSYFKSIYWQSISLCIALFAFTILIYQYKTRLSAALETEVSGVSQLAIKHEEVNNELIAIENKLDATNAEITAINSEMERVSKLESSVDLSEIAIPAQVQKPNVRKNKMLSTTMEYLTLPLDQFSQLPTFPINHETLEFYIAEYNQLKARLFHSSRKSDVPNNGQDQLALKQLLIQKKQQLQQTLEEAIDETNTANTRFLKINSKNSAMEIDDLLQERKKAISMYIALSEEYQRTLELVSADPSLQQPVTSIGKIRTNKLSPWLWAIFTVSAFSILIPVSIIFYQAKRYELVVRPVDISGTGRKAILKHLPRPSIARNKEGRKSLRNFQEIGGIINRNTASDSAKVVAVNSLNTGVGKAFVSDGIAAYFSHKSYRTVIVDISPHIAASTGTAPGLFAFITNSDLSVDAIIQKGSVAEELDYIYLGFPKGNGKSAIEEYEARLHAIRNDIMRSLRLHSLFQELKWRYDFILVKTPELVDQNDPVLDIPLKDFNVNVVRYRKTHRAEASLLYKIVGSQPQPSLMVLNDVGEVNANSFIY